MKARGSAIAASCWFTFCVQACSVELDSIPLVDDAARRGPGDASLDAATDAAFDAGADAATDAGSDAEVDAGTDELDAGPDAATPLSVEAFAQAFEETYCQWMASCRSAPSCDYGPLAATHAALPSSIPAAVHAGRVSFHAEQAVLCLAALEESLTVCDTPFLFFGTSGACMGVTRGALPAGGQCYPVSAIGTDECAEGYCSVAGTTSCPGQCIPFAQLEDPCPSGVRCAPNLRCDGSVCTALTPAGGECTSAGECEAGLQCLEVSASTFECRALGQLDDPCYNAEACQYPLDCEGGKCVTTVQPGGSCRSDASCPFPPTDPYPQVCFFDPSGATTTGTCKAPVPIDGACNASNECEGYSPSSNDGPHCTQHDGQTMTTCQYPGAIGALCNPRGCASLLYCKYDALSDGMWRCAAPGGIGDPCDPTYHVTEQCGGTLRCMSNGTCQAVGSEGDPCHTGQSDSCEQGLFCERAGYTCAALAGDGQACSVAWYGQPTGSSCQEGLYCSCKGVPCIGGYDPTMASPDEVCAERQPDGAACLEGRQCLSGYCNSSTHQCEELPKSNLCNGL